LIFDKLTTAGNQLDLRLSFSRNTHFPTGKSVHDDMPLDDFFAGDNDSPSGEQDWLV
jgi:hypothetical protein